jgi:two-component system cell cycle sensor histidine kinase/response regulator CckA
LPRKARDQVPGPRPPQEDPDRLRAVFDLTGDAIFILDGEGRFLDVNEVACERYAYAREEFLQRNMGEMDTPEQAPNWKARMAKVRRDGAAVFETVHRAKGGRHIHTEVNSRCIRREGSTFVVSICRDITGRVRAEEELRRSNALLAGTLDSTADGILVVDDAGRIISYNRKFLELWQIPEAVAASGDDNLALSHAIGQLKEPEAFMKKVQELYADKDAESFDILEFTTGKVFERYSIPLQVEGRSVGRVWNFRDVTGRKKMEKNQQIFASLVEHSTDLIGIASLDGKVFYLNRVGQELVGLDGLEEVRKTRIRDFAPEKHLNPLEKMLSSLSEEGTWKGEARIRNFKTGTRIPIEMHGFVIKDTCTGQPIALATICRDVSERKKMEEEMARSDKLNSIGILAGGIAHDFNNLLTVIFGNITLAKMFANRHSEVYQRLEESEKAAQRARDLTHQLLTFSKGGAPVKKTISVRELVTESASFVLRGSNVKCELSIPGDLWPVEADEGQLSQVLNNMIINAAHAMHGGGSLQVYCGNVNVDRNDPPLAKGRYILISIMDHGVGIPKNHLSKIFDPYFTTKKKGSGLGLSTSYSIVKNHGGHIQVKSETGIGTTFQVFLPASEEGKLPARVEEEQFASGKGKILVMDDEEAVRDVARSMLESLGYSVTLARDGNEAIAIYKTAMDSDEPFDSVLMDLTIPGGMGGMEAVRKIREIDSGVKAIVCSGYSNDTIMANYRRFGFLGVVPKPYSMKQLSGTITDVLSGAKPISP